ncbi:MAG: hypothetical protein AB1Y22_07020, partial [Cycloclasticus sp.]
DASVEASWVFTVALSDLESGSYSFELLGNLDHGVANTEDDIDLSFAFTATDSDGDTASSSFTVTVDDDSPVIITPENSRVDEEGLDGNTGDSYETDHSTSASVLLIPELEESSLTPALSDDAKDTIRSFVENGGNLVINGSRDDWDESLINDLFGFSITAGSRETGDVPTFTQTANVIGTDFESAPFTINNPNATYSWDVSSLPESATVMYLDGSNAAVVVIPVAEGQITFLAYDWYNAGPVGDQDGGWLEVLDVVVSQGSDEPADVAVFDNGSYVDTSGGSGAESDNIQATLAEQGHNVTTFTGIEASDFLAVLASGIAGDLAGEEVTASGSLGIQWGADDNNDGGSFDRSATFDDQDAPEGLSSNGLAISYLISEDGLTLTGYTGDDASVEASWVFTVALSDLESGSYSFELLGNLDHGVANTEDDIDLSFAFTATDSDGDTASSSFTLTVDDDAAILVSATDDLLADEDSLENANEDAERAGEVTAATVLTGNLADNFNFGADGAAAQAIYSVNGELADEGDIIITGMNYELVINAASGDYTFTLTDNILDSVEDGDVENLVDDAIQAVLEVVVEDADGDRIEGTVTLNVDVQDDIPVLVSATDDLLADEDSLENANNDDGREGEVTAATVLTGNLADNFNFGADGAAAQAIYSVNGELADEGDITITGMNYELVIDAASGDYTFTLTDNILDSVEGGDVENLVDDAIQAVLEVVVEDADGDRIEGTVTLNVDVQDDIPVIILGESTDSAAEFTIDNHDEVSSAGYHNSYGYYVRTLDADGNVLSGEPTVGVIIENDAHAEHGGFAEPVTVTGYSQEQIGYFIIPNGGGLNSGLDGGEVVSFAEVGGQWQAFTADGSAIMGAGSAVLFDVSALNSDGKDHMQGDELVGDQNWEDLQIPGDDGDYNDLYVNVEWTGVTVSGDVVEEVSFGADGEGSIDFSLDEGDINIEGVLESNGHEVMFKAVDSTDDGHNDQIIGYTAEDGDVLIIDHVLEGAYEVSILGPIDDVEGETHADVDITAHVAVTDGDGDMAYADLAIHIDIDMHQVLATPAALD